MTRLSNTFLLFLSAGFIFLIGWLMGYDTGFDDGEDFVHIKNKINSLTSKGYTYEEAFHIALMRYNE